MNSQKSNGIVVRLLAIAVFSQFAYADPSNDKRAEELREYFRRREVAETNWKNLQQDLGARADVSGYKGKEISFNGMMQTRKNPIEVEVTDSKVGWLVILKDEEVEDVAHYPADMICVSVTGIIRTIDLENKQVEVMSIETNVSAAE
jgi:hypothetical protein